MRLRSASFFGVIACSLIGGPMAQGAQVLDLSRDSTVMVTSKAGKSKGTGFFIGDRHVVTCFHVVAALSVQGETVNWSLHPDLKVALPSGETIDATVVSVPTKTDLSPLTQDFAVLKLKKKPSKKFAKVVLASGEETPQVGDEVVFSGYPLLTPGMVTHRGMVSGFNDSSSVIFVQASINKGNSGGALLNLRGHVVGIIRMREGGISQGLVELKEQIDKTSSQGKIKFMGVDTLESTKAIIQTLDRYISTGIGYARDVRSLRAYLKKHPALLK